MAWVGAEAAAAGAAVEDGGRPLLGVSAKSLICISFSHKPNETALLGSTSLASTIFSLLHGSSGAG